MFNYVASYRYLLPNLYLSVADIVNPDLFVCVCRTWISSTSPAFLRSSSSHPAGLRLACTKNRNRAPIAGGGSGLPNLHRVCQTPLLALACVGCVVWSLFIDITRFYEE